MITSVPDLCIFSTINKNNKTCFFDNLAKMANLAKNKKEYFNCQFLP